jgi:hypothetical protein
VTPSSTALSAAAEVEADVPQPPEVPPALVAAAAPAAGVPAAGAGWTQTTAAPASPANTDYTRAAACSAPLLIGLDPVIGRTQLRDGRCGPSPRDESLNS